MSRAWFPSPDLLRQIVQLLLRVGLAAAFGAWIGFLWPTIAATLLVSLIIHLRYLTRLRSWLNTPKQVDLPDRKSVV